MDPQNQEEDEEAKRCRLDRSLFALLYNELISSQFESTAKRLLKEAGVSSVELTNGVPPRLRDLVDVWNEVQTVPVQRVFSKQTSTLPYVTQRQPAFSGMSAAIAAAGSSVAFQGRAGKPESQTDGEQASDQRGEEDAESGGPTAAKGASQTGETTYRARSGIYGMYLPPLPLKKITESKDESRMKEGKGTRGPWLTEEEMRLKMALEKYGEANLELIQTCVKSRSVKGIAKHLMKTKKGWGIEYNRRLFDVFVNSEGAPSIEELLAVKPKDKSEKDLLSWMEWFIVYNNSFHSHEDYALEEKEKVDQIRAERERQEREACLELHPNILDEAVVPKTKTASSSHRLARMNGHRERDYEDSGAAPTEPAQKRARAEPQPWTTEEDETLKASWSRFSGDVRRLQNKVADTHTVEEVAQRIAYLQARGELVQEIKHSSSIPQTLFEPTSTSEESSRPSSSSQFIIKWTAEEVKAFNRVYSQSPGNIDALCASVPRRTRGAVMQRIRDITERRAPISEGESDPRKNGS